MENVSNMFRSRKFTLAVVWQLITLLVAAVPVLAPHLETITVASGIVVVLAIFGIAGEDAFRVWAENRPVSSQDALRTIFEEVITRFVPIPAPPVPPTGGTQTVIVAGDSGAEQVKGLVRSAVPGSGGNGIDIGPAAPPPAPPAANG